MDTEGNKGDFLDAEELVSLARRYYAARFPNSQRLGCPPEGEIARVIRQRRIPDEALREHMFECSECFGEYRQSLAQYSGQAAGKSAWRKHLAGIMDRVVSIGPWKISAASAVLILLSLVIFLSPRNAPESGKDVVAGSQPSEPRPGDGAKDGKESSLSQTADAGEVLKSQGEDLAIAGVNASTTRARRHEIYDVDLDNYQVFSQTLRGSATDVSGDRSAGKGSGLRGKPAVELYKSQSGEGEKIISLPATSASMVLRLPETAVPGKYKVSLIDAYGKPLLSTSAVSPDGSRLRVALDLRHISPKKYRLRLERDGEAPAIYNVIIGAR